MKILEIYDAWVRRTFPQYAGVDNIFAIYWRNYGGKKSLLKSPYLAIAFLLCLIMYSSWCKDGWWNTPISILPSLIGFTLGGYAIFTAFGNEKFKELISGSTEGESDNISPFMEVNSAFAHFILLQIFSLIYALIAQSQPLKPIFDMVKLPTLESWIAYPFWFIGYFLFLYAITSAIAATFALFRIAYWYDSFITRERKRLLQQEHPDKI